MSKDIMLTVIKNKDKESIINMIETEGKIETLSAFAEVLDRRAYFTVNSQGDIKRKEINLAIPVFAFSEEVELLAQTIIELSDLKERNKISTINRFSNLEVTKLKENLMKTMVNGNLEFSKKYGKELFLRNRDEFFKTTTQFALMGNMKSLKPLMVLAFKKLMENREYNENIFYLMIAFLTKYRDEFSFYESIQYENIESIENIKEIIINNIELLKSREGLEALSSLAAIEILGTEKKDKFLFKIKKELEGIKKFTPLSQTEKHLLSFLL